MSINQVDAMTQGRKVALAEEEILTLRRVISDRKNLEPKHSENKEDKEVDSIYKV